MTPKQKARVLEIVKGDCEIDCYYCENGKTCAVGALAIASGISKLTLEHYGGMGILSLLDIIGAIHRKFDLNGKQLHKIQSLNDKFETPPPRRRAITKYINSL